MPENIFNKIKGIENNAENIISSATLESDKAIKAFKDNWENEIKETQKSAKEKGLQKIKIAKEEAKKEISKLEKEKEQKISHILDITDKNKEKAKNALIERFNELWQ